MRANHSGSGKKILFLLTAILLAGILAGCVLKDLAADARRAVLQNGEYRFSAQDLEAGLWLLQGSQDAEDPNTVCLTLYLPEDVSCSLLTSATIAEGLTINGESGHYAVTGSNAIVTLPLEEKAELVFSKDVERLLLVRNDSLYLGTVSRIQNKLCSIQKNTGIREGFFLFSILFSLTLYIFKPSEKYLLFFAIHACIPRLLGSGSLMAELFPTLSYFVSMVEVSYLYQYLYILLNGAIHWLIYREFVNDRIGKYPYIVYLAGCTVLFSLATAIFREALAVTAVSYLLYLIMYCLEGIVLFKCSWTRRQDAFAAPLAAGWCFSLIFWTVRAANNLGYIEYPFALGAYVALGYTISFLLCINGKFAAKYKQADQLLVETNRLNDKLKELNNSLEQKVSDRTADLNQAMESLEKTQAAKNALMTNIIHNLKTPLFSLKGYAELLKETAEKNDPDAGEVSYLSHICSNVDYIQDMISQLLLFDRLEEKKITFHIVTVTLSGFLSRLEAAVYGSLREKNLTLQIRNDMPADCTVDVDEFYLKQAVVCILDNAIRYSPEGSSIDLHAYTGDSGRLMLDITDYGAGMSPQVCAQIFERGYSHHDNGGKSSGLGLNIASEILREHGGSITVRSAEGQGSTFTLHIPAGQEPGQQTAAAPAAV